MQLILWLLVVSSSVVVARLAMVSPGVLVVIFSVVIPNMFIPAVPLIMSCSGTVMILTVCSSVSGPALMQFWRY